MSRRTAFAAAFALAALALPGAARAAEAVVLQLSGPAQFEFAGYYAALWLGYYRDAGLDVTISTDEATGQQAPIDPVREVAQGRAQFGIGTMQLVIRRAQGLPILLVAPIFQQSGSAIYYRADTAFSSPAALVNARLGRLPASDILDIELATALRAEGIDPGKIKSVTVDASQIVAKLADRSIDAVAGSAWTVPWQAQQRGLVLKSFNPANYRVEYYGDSLFTMQRFAVAEPDTVRHFRAASLKGWEYALQHPNEIIDRFGANKPAESTAAYITGLNGYQADIARRLAHYPEIPLGYSSNDRWTQIEAGMLGAGVLERSVDLTGFVYSPGPETPSGTGFAKTIAIVGAVLGGAAALGAAVWYGWRRWRVSASRPRNAAETVPGAGLAAVSFIARRRAGLSPLPSHSPPRPTPTDLNAVLAPLERRIRQRLRGKVRYRFSLVTGLWPCRTEGGAVAAIVLDLVSAAAAAMAADGTLIVGTRNFAFDEENLAGYPGGRIGEFARITVRDSGPGLTDPEFERILDPQTTTRPGIARAAAVMEGLGGFVRVESAEGIGTAVHLYFARVGDEKAAELIPTAAVAE